MPRSHLTLFSDQTINAMDFYSKHLPEKMFRYLTERHLLNSPEKNFLSLHELETIVTVSVTCVPRDKNNSFSHVLLMINTQKENNHYICKHYFRDKHWVNEDFITSAKTAYSFGLEKFSQNDILTKDEWKKIRQNKINAILLQLSFLMKEIKVNPQKVKII